MGNKTKIAEYEKLFNTLPEKERNSFLNAAKNAIDHIKKEKIDFFSKEYQIISQDDKRGCVGDIRDIVLKNEIDEIGISAKNNNSSTKHSRLSRNLNFGDNWIGIPNSKQYFEDINPIFDLLNKYTQENLKWSEVENKEENFYFPLLKAFKKEIEYLYEKNKERFSENFITFLIGKQNYFKIIKKTNNKVSIEYFNMFESGNENKLKLPTKMNSIDFKEKSKNTIVINFDNDWTLSLRIHNASSRVERSLKFDVKILQYPNNLKVVTI